MLTVLLSASPSERRDVGLALLGEDHTVVEVARTVDPFPPYKGDACLLTGPEDWWAGALTGYLLGKGCPVIEELNAPSRQFFHREHYGVSSVQEALDLLAILSFGLPDYEKRIANSTTPDKRRKTWERGGRLLLKRLPEIKPAPSVEERPVTYAETDRFLCRTCGKIFLYSTTRKHFDDKASALFCSQHCYREPTAGLKPDSVGIKSLIRGWFEQLTRNNRLLVSGFLIEIVNRPAPETGPWFAIGGLLFTTFDDAVNFALSHS